ncbi:hypothetical protein ACFTXK_31625, partial [Streptomyces sp. NPDC056956]
YLRGAGTARGSPSGQDHKPGFRDSTKPGAAHLIDWQYQSGRISRRWLQDFYRITAGADQD